MTIPTTNTRHLDTDKRSVPAALPPPTTSFIGHCTSVKWWWHDIAGEMKGYELIIDGKLVQFGKDETEDIPFYLPRPIVNSHDHIDVDLTVAYKASGQIISIKERKMDQSVEKTTGADELNKGLGHWGAPKEDYKAFIMSARKALADMNVHKLQGTALTAAQIARWADSPSDKLTDSPHANKTLALEAVIAKGKAFVEAKAAEKAASEHEHIFDKGKCTVCGQHWIKVEKIRSAFHAWLEDLMTKHNADEKTSEARYQYAKEALGLSEHMEETELSPDEAKAEIQAMVEAMYPNGPDKLAKELLIKWMPEFKTINTDAKNVNEAVTLILTLFGEVKTLAEVVANIGVDGAQKIWDESKQTLKPAAPK